MLYNKLWEIAVRADWRLMTDEYKALAVGTVVVAVVMIWNRIRIRKRTRTIESRLSRIETQLNRMQNEINTILQIQVPLVTQLNARAKINPTNAKVETDGCDIAELTTSPPTTARQPEITKSAEK